MSDIQEYDNSSIYNKMLKVKNEMTSVKKMSNNPFFKSKYADLNALLDVVEPVLEKNGLFLIQPCTVGQLGNMVESVIVDPISGKRISSVMIIPNLEDMQKLGGAVTYARRYTLQSLLSIKAEDDDGNLASGRLSKSKSKKVTSGDF